MLLDGSYIYLFDSTAIDRFISYISYKTLYNELQYQKGMNYKFIYPNLYLDGYYSNVVIEMTVRPRLLTDVEDTSMYCVWVKEYVLALCKELLGRVRGKFNVEGSPYNLDSAQLLQEAQTEKENLENQLIRRNIRTLIKGDIMSNTSKLFESYKSNLNEKVNQDNIDINNKIRNPEKYKSDLENLRI